MELTPEIIKNADFEGFVINKVNNQKMIDNPDLRFERLHLVSQHSILLAAKCIIHCFLPQERERRFILGLAEELIKDYDNPEQSAAAFVSLARLGAWDLVSEQYFILKSISNAQKQTLTPYYLKHLKFNGVEQEQRFLFTMLINLATSFEEAKSFFYAMEMQHILPSEYSYTSVMNKADTWENAHFWFVKAANSGFPPDEVSYSILMKIAHDFDKALALLQDMKAQSIKPDVITYNTLISLSQDYDKGIVLLQEMKAEGIKPDTYTYSTLISLSQDYDKGIALLQEMKDKHIKPNDINYNNLITLSQDYDKGFTLLQDMKAQGVKPNIYHYSNLIGLSKDYDKAIALLKEMKAQGVEPNTKNYNTLINLSQDYDKGIAILQEMKEQRINPEIQQYSHLINLSQDYDKALALLQEMKAIGIAPNQVVYNAYIKNMPTYALMAQAYKNLKEEGHLPDAQTFMPMLNKCTNKEELSHLLKEIQAFGIVPDKKLEIFLLRKMLPFKDFYAQLLPSSMEKVTSKTAKNYWATFQQAFQEYAQNALKIGDIRTAKVIGYNSKNTVLYLRVEKEIRQCRIHIKYVGLVQDLRKEYPVGKEIMVQLIAIDEQYGISCALPSAPNVGDIVKGKVTGYTENKMKVKVSLLPEGHEAVLHITELGWQVQDLANEVRIGQELEVKVIQTDTGEIRVSLKEAKPHKRKRKRKRKNQ